MTGRTIDQTGDPCRHCRTPVVLRRHKPGWRPKLKQAYFFEWWFSCPSCHAAYMVAKAQRDNPDFLNQPQADLLNLSPSAEQTDAQCLAVLQECQPDDFQNGRDSGYYPSGNSPAAVTADVKTDRVHGSQ